MRYFCQFPSCSYETNQRNQIDLHHIIPKETGGKDDKWNRIYLCPNCHRKIYIPEAKKGMHSKKGNDSIILLNKHFSTNGQILEYKDQFDNIQLINIPIVF